MISLSLSLSLLILPCFAAADTTYELVSSSGSSTGGEVILLTVNGAATVLSGSGTTYFTSTVTGHADQNPPSWATILQTLYSTQYGYNWTRAQTSVPAATKYEFFVSYVHTAMLVYFDKKIDGEFVESVGREASVYSDFYHDYRLMAIPPR